MPTARSSLYRRHRFPPEVISYAVWLYFRFPLSLRMVEEMLAARGICVTYETVRQWGKKFGKAFADQIRRGAPGRGDKWHMDEVVVSIAGETHWLWRAVDQLMRSESHVCQLHTVVLKGPQNANFVLKRPTLIAAAAMSPRQSEGRSDLPCLGGTFY